MRFKKTLFIFACTATGCLILFLGVLASLSTIMESQLKNRLAKISTKVPIGFEIEKLGFSNTFISHISIAEGISIDGLNIKYKIKSFFSPRIRKVVVSGLTIHAQLNEENQISIPGIEIKGLSKKQQTDQQISSYFRYLPEKLVLKNAKVVLNFRGRELLIPLEMLSKIYIEKNRVVARATVYPFGEKINCLLEYDLKKGVDKVKINSNSFDTGHLNQFVHKTTDQFRLSGLVDFNLSSAMPEKEWTLYISQIGVEKPVAAKLKEIHSTFLLDQGFVSAKGSMEAVDPMIGTIPMLYEASFQMKNGILYDMKLNTGKIDKILLEQTENKLSIQSPVVSISVKGNQKKGSGKINFSAKQTKVLSHASTGGFPKISAQGVFEYGKNGKPYADIVVKTSKGIVELPEQKIKMSGISFEIPYQYPLPAKNIKGHYSIANINYNDQYQLSSNGRMVQTGMTEVKINGRAILDKIENAELRFDAAVGFEKKLYGKVDFGVDPFVLTDAQIKKIVPQLFPDGEVNVTLSASGQAQMVNNKITSSLKAKIKDGSVHIPDTQFTASGVNATISFNDLLVPETIPGQVLTIDEVKVDKVKFEDTVARFSIEDGASLLIENIRFKWCNGLVTTEAIRFPQKTDTYRFSLYCDRLELTRLLEQVGAFNADGSGTLNGRIPIVYSNGEIAFDNGFLFSTPGSGGKIQVENTDTLTAGIPLDSPQFAELDVAREALKNFNYKWAKLTFNTFEDALYVNMELDGKPSHIMPFEYKKEIGRFVRVDASSPGSHFQGIKLDVNLNLPFNEVMEFGNKLKSIFK